MAGMSVSGLVSGLNTAELISQLLQVEAIPQSKLKNRVSATERMVTALQGINTKVAALATAAKKLTEPATFQGATATSSTPGVTATAAPGALAGQLAFDVLDVARSTFHASAAFSDLGDLFADAGARQLTLTRGDTSVTLDLTGKDLAGIVSDVNAAEGLDLQAAVLTNADGSQRLQITSRATGSASDFDVTGLAGGGIKRAGTDAQVDLGGGLVVTSATNTFTNLMPGTTVTVTAPATGVVVSTAANSAPTVDAVKGLVDTLKAALADLGLRTSTGNGNPAAAGVLAGDATMRQLSQQLLGAVSVPGSSPAAAGIELTRTGGIDLDVDKLTAALADDPAGTTALLTDLAGRLHGLAKQASDGSSSTLAQAIEAKTSAVKDLTSSIEDWDRRLEVRRTGLQRQFAALEVALSSMQQQSSWLAGQIAGLPKWSNGS